MGSQRQCYLIKRQKWSAAAEQKADVSHHSGKWWSDLMLRQISQRLLDVSQEPKSRREEEKWWWPSDKEKEHRGQMANGSCPKFAS